MGGHTFLEVCTTSSETSSKVLDMPKSELERKSVSVLFKNQGIYNGLIGVLLLVNLFSLIQLLASCCFWATLSQ
ncbi:MAG: DUF1304 family protein [Olegusella sp.]|nr:DUF1304 family protein [Olegusella sp.]